MSAGIGYPDTLDALEDVTAAGAARGDLLMKGAGDWARLAPGPAGYQLASAGAGADLTWAPPPAAGVSDHGGLTGLADDDHAQYLLLAGRGAGQTIASGNLTLTTGNLTVTAGVISAPGGQSNAERYGAASSVTGSGATALGNGAAAGASSVSIGRACTGTGSLSVAVGVSAGTSTFNSAIAIGNLATVTADTGIALGKSASAGSGSLALGSNAVAGNISSIALGNGATTNADNQLAIGGTAGGRIDATYFGKGPVNAAPTATSLNATGGSGTDIAGASLTLAGGRGTGTGAGGSLLFQTAPAGTTGTGLNTLATRLTIDQRGNIVPGTAALATTATDGFLYLPTCAGTPTGVPTAYTGRVPVLFDTTGLKIWAYTGGAWKQSAAFT